jgi:predicted O-linked N-acetylglucosamine transferase (SPINDLY family)
MAMKMRKGFGQDAVSQGTLSNEEFKLLAGITPESLELFGNMLGLDSTGDDAQDQAFQEYLRRTKTNRSAMRRLIHRQGIAGYSEDVGRVLASFIYSNARQTSAGLHMGELGEAVTAIPKQQGELKDAAVQLSEYVKNPQEEAQAIRGLLFAQYLGGSIASAVVNMSQPAAVTFPWLSQFGGARQAAAELGRAAKNLANKGHRYEADLAAALKHAEEEGTVSPQEVHQLMAQARGSGSLRPGDGTRTGDALASAGNALTRLSLAWGKVFGAAEQVNRRMTYIAAFRIAKAQKMANPAAFAKKAVIETQFTYSKANKSGTGAVAQPKNGLPALTFSLGKRR